MKVLLLHPKDSPWQGPWARMKWDLVVDLGWAGRPTYEWWSQKFGCPVLGLYDFGRDIEDAREIKGIMCEGYGHLLDSEGLDWWEIMSPMIRYELLCLLLMSRIGQHLKSAQDIAASRSSVYVQALQVILEKSIACFFPGERIGLWAQLQNYAKVACNARNTSQLVEVALDKWDPTFALRRWMAPRRNRSSHEPVVLLPSGYVNVSRVVMQYAKMLPDRKFLLVTIRRSARLIEPLPNVTMTSLASYVFPNRSRKQELLCLFGAWEQFRKQVVQKVKELTLAESVGVLSSYPALIQRGLAFRDAWRQVFERELIEAVLCGDENNMLTRLPVILGNNRGVPTVSCHHGALDGNMLVRQLSSTMYLVKGEMEKDYLVKVCGLPSERVVVGAPSNGGQVDGVKTELDRSSCTRIVFFSEPHELYFGRVEEAYKEILPRLCAVARRTGRKVAVKLHPFESRRARTRIIDSILSADDRLLIEIIDAPLSTDLLQKTWFGLAIESSVTTECARRGVPCFLCGWLDAIRYGYMRQYDKFAAGNILDSPDDIEHIPELLQTYKITPDIQQKLWDPVSVDDIQSLLTSHTLSALHIPPGTERQARGPNCRANANI